jgi:hypothetical protein
VKIRDTGTFDVTVWEVNRIEIILHGMDRAVKYNLIRSQKGDENAWLILKSRA